MIKCTICNKKIDFGTDTSVWHDKHNTERVDHYDCYYGTIRK